MVQRLGGKVLLVTLTVLDSIYNKYLVINNIMKFLILHNTFYYAVVLVIGS